MFLHCFRHLSTFLFLLKYSPALSSLLNWSSLKYFLVSFLQLHFLSGSLLLNFNYNFLLQGNIENEQLLIDLYHARRLQQVYLDMKVSA